MRNARAYIYAALCLLTAAVFFFLFAAPQAETPLPAQGGTQYVFADTPLKREVYYAACRHLLTDRPDEALEFRNRSFAELREAGWYVFRNENGEVCLYREEEGLCPNDAGKYHMVWLEDSLVIVHGPCGYNGEVEGRMTLVFERLPHAWQELLRGEGVEFGNRAELITAMESLDEL